MSEQVRYITNEQGERVGVLLDLEAYNRLANPLALDDECLIGLSRDELQALADSKLAPAAQNQLNDLLVQNAEAQLSADEVANLDRLLVQVDQLTILKTRARYTLHCQNLSELRCTGSRELRSHYLPRSLLPQSQSSTRSECPFFC